jgi:predicted metal-dependent phosphoesterase TrpH
MVGMRYRFRVWGTLIPLALAAAVMARSNEPTVEELKARVASASVRDRPHLCVEIAQKQLTEADKLYAASDFDKGQAALTDVVAFSELARDYAIQSHKYQKQTEIATRNMTRKLNDLLHSLGHDDRVPVQDAINRLQRVRDDLLASMFPKGAK